MKILAFVDIHEDRAALKKIESKAKKADLLICAGDISVFSKDLERLIEFLDKMQKEVLIIHGNHEDEVRLKKLAKKCKNITFFHKIVVERQGYSFIGYGGLGFAQEDEEFDAFINEHKELLKNKKTVLITHAPPWNTVLDLIGKKHAGNKNIRQFIVDYKPLYAISGHFHENAGKESRLDQTILLNPGPSGKILDLN